MYIETIEIKNFRSIKHQVVQLNKYNAFIGSNGAGKSNILAALNVFFREQLNNSTSTSIMVEEDFFNKNTAEPIEITVTFGDLPTEAKSELGHYVRANKLIISTVANFEKNTGIAEVTQHGSRLGVADFAPFYAAGTVSEKKTIYTELRGKHELPDAKTGANMAEALHEYEEANPAQCHPIRSSDQFYGFSKGSNKLAQFVQWVYVPAVKDAGSEELASRNTALKILTERLVENEVDFSELQTLQKELSDRYEGILADNSAVLESLSKELTASVREWANPSVAANLQRGSGKSEPLKIEHPVTTIKLADGAFEGNVSRFGHGFQRSFLITLLTKLVATNGENPRTLLLGIEEPELYQHPLQIRQISDVLRSLSKRSAQVFATTHSPHLVDGQNFESVKLVRKCNSTGASQVTQTTLEKLNAGIARCAGKQPQKPEGFTAHFSAAMHPVLNEMFFGNRLVLVEGKEEVAYITAYLHLMDLWETYRQKGVVIVPVEGKSHLLRPAVVAALLELDFLLVFDCDYSDRAEIAAFIEKNTHDPEKQKSKLKKIDQDIILNRKDNMALFRSVDLEENDGFPNNDIFLDNIVAWRTNIGDTFKSCTDEVTFNKHMQKCKNLFSAKSLEKNSMFIGELTKSLWEDGHKSPQLQDLCNLIVR